MTSSVNRRLGVLHGHLDDSQGTSVDRTDAASCLRQQPCRAALPLPPQPAASPLVVVGGMVMDLQAHPSGPADVQRGGSVPGSVRQSTGGVARNVAEALALLLKSAHPSSSSSSSSRRGDVRGPVPPPPPLLVSAVGDDLAGSALLQHWQSLGLSTACIPRLPGAATPTVAVVFDLRGEVAASVADVALLEKQLGPQLLRQPPVAAALAAAPLIMADGNLSEAALEEVCRQAAAAGVPVWFEPVSVPKSVRAAWLLSLLTYISPNEKELAAMAAAVRQGQQHSKPCCAAGKQAAGGCSCSGSGCGANRCCCCCSSTGQSSTSHACSSCGTLPAAACCSSSCKPVTDEAAPAWLRSMLPDIATLLRAGVKHIVVTLGPDGAALCTLAADERAVTVCHLPALPAQVVNCSGAGDCLVAGCLYALSSGLLPEAALAHGIAASKVAVESHANVASGLNAAAVAAGVAALEGRETRLRLPLRCCCCC